MKTLVIVAHPNLMMSRVHKVWTEQVQAQTEITVHKLYEAYPIRNIHIYKEQELILTHDRIILQYPLLWYSMPSLLKQWQEEVFASIWSRNEAFLMEKREVMLAISIGAPKEAYDEDGFNGYSLEEIDRPIEIFSNLNNLYQLPTFSFFNAIQATQEEIHNSAEQYLEHIYRH